MMHGKSGNAACCFPTGNKYRGKHDDGSRKSRRSAGGMAKKHYSPAHNSSY